MIDKIRELLGISATKESKNDDAQAPHLIAAILMVHVALEHDGLSDKETQSILQCLKDYFKLDDSVAQKILDIAIKREEAAIELYSFTREITQNFDQKGRQDIIRLLWKVAFSDGHLDHFENNIISKIADLLCVSIRDRVHLKQEVQASL